ncbi:hypothetical protein LSAT2_003811 [Lamellibrachia satsuma]|nr:hypothetical protein LSAT2_003811 [Lamellibrachia satsuma]
MRVCYAICATVAIVVTPCILSACIFQFKQYRYEHIPLMTVMPDFQTSRLCEMGCMRDVSCVAMSWQQGQQRCYFLTDGTKLSDRQASTDTDLYVMTSRCPLPNCSADNPCKNGGTCHAASTGPYFLVCDCLPGYSGPECQLSVPDGVLPPSTRDVLSAATTTATAPKENKSMAMFTTLQHTFSSAVRPSDGDLIDVPPTTGTPKNTSIALYCVLGMVALLLLLIGTCIVYKKKRTKEEKGRPEQSERRPEQGRAEAGARGAEAGARGAEAGARGAEAGARGAEAGARRAEAGARRAEAGARGAEAGARGAEAGARGAEAGARRAEAGARRAEAGARGAEAGARRSRREEHPTTHRCWGKLNEYRRRKQWQGKSGRETVAGKQWQRDSGREKTSRRMTPQDQPNLFCLNHNVVPFRTA